MLNEGDRVATVGDITAHLRVDRSGWDRELNSSATVRSTTWNGPICSTCHRGYIGHHECAVEDLQRRIDALQAKIDHINDTC